jgi:hypothetical protein
VIQSPLAARIHPRDLLVVLGVAWLCGWGCASDSAPGAANGSWEGQMRSGVDAANSGQPALAIASFERAVELARRDPRRPNRIAYAAWHLGDVCFRQPDLCPTGQAERSTRESLAVFMATYGPEHPVVIPVLLRLAALRDADADPQAANALSEQADRITERWFPESHYLRSHMGAYRPASSLHPQELLRILSELDLLDG